MNVDPRTLNYPAHDDRDTTGTNEELEQIRQEDSGSQVTEEEQDRRTGTNDELKELDRVERRKKE